MSITFRPARSSDVDVAVPLIYSSGPDAFDYVFADDRRPDGTAFLRKAYVDGRGQFGFRNHTVALDAGRIVGIGAAYGHQGPSWAAVASIQILRTYGPFGAPSVIRRGLRIERVMPPPGANAYYIAHLGVDEERRSEGIGTKLVNRFVAEARTLGHRTAELDVSVDNPRAQKLYEVLGFRVLEESESDLATDHGEVVNHRRMVKTL